MPRTAGARQRLPFRIRFGFAPRHGVGALQGVDGHWYLPHPTRSGGLCLTEVSHSFFGTSGQESRRRDIASSTVVTLSAMIASTARPIAPPCQPAGDISGFPVARNRGHSFGQLSCPPFLLPLAEQQARARSAGQSFRPLCDLEFRPSTAIVSFEREPTESHASVRTRALSFRSQRPGLN